MQLKKMHDPSTVWGGVFAASSMRRTNSHCAEPSPLPRAQKKKKIITTTALALLVFWGGSLNSREMFCGDAVRAPGRWAVSAAGTASYRPASKKLRNPRIAVEPSWALRAIERIPAHLWCVYSTAVEFC